ncbi:12084_t:CDS:2, partial [Acaulospora morrowiae]
EYLEELKSWDWTFGQTPEFTHEFEQSFTWGHMKAFIKSRDGIITAVTLTPSNIEYENLSAILEDSLEGNKYDDEGITQAVSKSLVDVQLSNTSSNGVITPSTSSLIRNPHEILMDIGNWIVKSL